MLLISAAEVKELAFMVRETIEEGSIRPIKIDIAQEQYIRPRLGERLFDRVLSGEYSDFVSSYLKPALAHYVRASIIDELSIQITDSGVIVYQGAETKSEVVNKMDTIVQDIDVTSSETLTSSGTDTETLNGSEVLVGSDDTVTLHNINEDILNYPVGEEDKSRDQNATTTTTQSAKVVSSKSDTTALTSENSLSRSNGHEGQSTTTNEGSVGASATERRVLTLRAYGDAKILMAKAIRYIERNLEQFPEYEPLNISQRVFF